MGGTGLGLSIVKHAIEQMDGKVTVESTLGRGSRFTIALPLEATQPNPADCNLPHLRRTVNTLNILR